LLIVTVDVWTTFGGGAIANMTVSREKTKFFKESVEYLGLIVSKDGKGQKR